MPFQHAFTHLLIVPLLKRSVSNLVQKDASNTATDWAACTWEDLYISAWWICTQIWKTIYVLTMINYGITSSDFASKLHPHKIVHYSAIFTSKYPLPRNANVSPRTILSYSTMQKQYKCVFNHLSKIRVWGLQTSTPKFNQVMYDLQPYKWQNNGG